MQGVGTQGRLGRPDAEGRRPDGMSTQRLIQNCDLRLVRPVPQTHPAHQAQSEILADEVNDATGWGSVVETRMLVAEGTRLEEEGS